ncbi:hypothetical protein F9C07_8796 [Aspergillus flavus]|uniref:Uncharacterized protein n=1 Tax=Aspergillus flavus (strain ATCC 200026 / FGSC A1120 / IAM 13836 / NRRL 3357 / JCM 12722 / SRRC 167) TaxID=332952 RepID=A0A7U2MIY5_ASPFN|nr:hypothetical protein F9C07_8796 [Aspergillus flavus]
MGERKRGVSPDGWDIPTMHCNTVFGAMMTRLRAEPWPTALVDGLGRSAQFVKATETRASGFAWEISGMQVAGQGYKGNTRQSATQMLLGDFPTLGWSVVENVRHTLGLQGGTGLDPEKG